MGEETLKCLVQGIQNESAINCVDGGFMKRHNKVV